MKRFLEELNNVQLSRLSEIAGNLGLIFFASVVLPVLLGEKPSSFQLTVSGASLTLASWFVSIWLLKGAKK